MNRVFVTGGSGFIGTNLLESLHADRIELINYDLKAPLNPSHRSMHVKGDILDPNHLFATMSSFKPNAFVHLAARADLAGTTIQDYAANTTGVRNVIAAIQAEPSVYRAVFASSRYVHGNELQPSRDDDYSPSTLYGQSKAEGETIVRTSGLEVPWVIIRPTSIWGPWFDVPYKGFFQAVRRGLYIHPLRERIFKSFGYVGNVVHQIRRLLEVPAESIHGRTLYVADYEPVEIRSMAEMVSSQFGGPPVRQAPVAVMKTVAVAGDILKRTGWYNPPLTSFRLRNLRSQMVYDLSATAKIVGSLPHALEDGVVKTVEWMKHYD